MSGNIDRYGLEDVLHSFNALSDLCVTPCSNLKKKKKLVLLFILFYFCSLLLWVDLQQKYSWELLFTDANAMNFT